MSPRRQPDRVVIMSNAVLLIMQTAVWCHVNLAPGQACATAQRVTATSNPSKLAAPLQVGVSRKADANQADSSGATPLMLLLKQLAAQKKDDMPQSVSDKAGLMALRGLNKCFQSVGTLQAHWYFRWPIPTSHLMVLH